jgi:hypothetical protein
MELYIAFCKRVAFLFRRTCYARVEPKPSRQLGGNTVHTSNVFHPCEMSPETKMEVIHLP